MAPVPKHILKHETYDRRILLGASRRRFEDSEVLHNASRWAASMYLGGYAIECALKALICYHKNRRNFKDTPAFTNLEGNQQHNLALLLTHAPATQALIRKDRRGMYKPAWDLITVLWQKDHLRYWNRVGNQRDCTRFLKAVKTIHRFLLAQQGEAS